MISRGWCCGRTGEFCGSAFFVQLNTKFHALQPDNETFAAEIERESTVTSHAFEFREQSYRSS